MAGPVTGKFQADFTSFYSAVEKAEVSLKSFEGNSSKVGTALNRMADGFSGRRVIQEATMMAEAIREIGGVSKLSTAEAARSLRTLDEAMDKMLRTGQEIPTSMMKQAAQLRDVGRASNLADAAVSRLGDTYRKIDGPLKMMGINLDAEVRAIEDLNTLVTDTLPELGALGSAIAVVGTAFASWKFGEHIGKVYGLTDAIAKGTAVLRGYGDVLEQEAMAQADSLELAVKAAENRKRQQKAVQDAVEAEREHTETLRENWRITEGNANAMARLAEQLEAAKEKRIADARATFQASQAQSIFTDETKASTTAVDEHTAALNRQEESIKRAKAIADAEKARQDAFMNAPTLNDRKSFSASYDIPSLVGFALDEAIARGSAFTAGGSGIGTDPALALTNLMRQLEAKEGRYQITNNEQFFAMQRDQVLLAQLRQLQGSGKIPGFANGVENFEGGLAYVHKNEMLVNMPKGTSVVPAGKGGTVINVTIHANSKQNGEDAGRGFVKYLRQSGQLLPAGVGA